MGLAGPRSGCIVAKREIASFSGNFRVEGYSGETLILGSHSAAPTDGMMLYDLVCERNRVQTLNPPFITSCEPNRSPIRIGYC
jgi:hypothetical protein